MLQIGNMGISIFHGEKAEQVVGKGFVCLKPLCSAAVQSGIAVRYGANGVRHPASGVLIAAGLCLQQQET